MTLATILQCHMSPHGRCIQFIYVHTHTNTCIYIYRYIYVCVCIRFKIKARRNKTRLTHKKTPKKNPPPKKQTFSTTRDSVAEKYLYAQMGFVEVCFCFLPLSPTPYITKKILNAVWTASELCHYASDGQVCGWGVFLQGLEPAGTEARQVECTLGSRSGALDALGAYMCCAISSKVVVDLRFCTWTCWSLE